jgi:hypothetical protein
MAADLVYFLYDPRNAALKVGHSTDVLTRLDAIQTANPARLDLLGTLPGGASAERRCHRLFAEHRHRGEWFDATPEVLRAVRRLLVLEGQPRTVQDESTRRRGCRYGLRGVEVALYEEGLQPFFVAASLWDCRGCLLVSVRDATGHLWPDVPAHRVFLMADWPAVCPCWY